MSLSIIAYVRGKNGKKRNEIMKFKVIAGLVAIGAVSFVSSFFEKLPSNTATEKPEEYKELLLAPIEKVEHNYVQGSFGTVGLSCGITGELKEISKFVLIFLMYFGRIGILTLAIVVAKSSDSSTSLYKYADAHISVG